MSSELEQIDATLRAVWQRATDRANGKDRISANWWNEAATIQALIAEAETRGRIDELKKLRKRLAERFDGVMTDNAYLALEEIDERMAALGEQP